MDNGRHRILMIGPLPPPFGGARVLFENFIKEMGKNQEIYVEVIPTWQPDISMTLKVCRAAIVILKMIIKAGKFDIISFWASRRGMLAFGPVVGMICSLYQKPWILRKFGRGFSERLSDMGFLHKWLKIHVLRSADLTLLETQAAVELMREEVPGGRYAWHANFRKIPDIVIDIDARSKRFIYLGKVKNEKGIREIVQAAEKFNSERILVDIYGPLESGFSPAVFDDCAAINYCGIIDPEEVPQLLNSYYALLLPTYWISEGYPGVLLEAFSVGLPVITTNWLSIPEIVDETCGVLIEPGDSEDLFQAMNNLLLDSEHYHALVLGALKMRDLYALEEGVKIFLSYCDSVVQQGSLSGRE